MTILRTRSLLGVTILAALMPVLISLNPALASNLQLQFIGSGRPEQVIVRTDGADDKILKDPWTMPLPNIPAELWQVQYRLVIARDTTQEAAQPREVEIPIRYSLYHAQNFPILRIPIYILTDSPEINNGFVSTFEPPLLGETEQVKALYNARYAYLRASDRDGNFGQRILFSYLERAAGFNNLFRYINVGDDVLDLVRQLLDDPDAAKHQLAQKRFKTWTGVRVDQGNVSRMDQLRYAAWDDLALAMNTANPQLRDENARCILIRFYLDQFYSQTTTPQIQKTITGRLGFTDANWTGLRNAVSTPPCKVAKTP